MRVRNIVILAGTCILLSLFLNMIEPRKTQIRIFDAQIDKTYKNEKVPFILCLFIVYACPLIILFYMFRRYKHPKVENTVYFYFVLSIMLNMMITDSLKVMVGRQRPDYIYRTQLKHNSWFLKQFHIREGRKSFPSGHTSCTLNGIVFFNGICYIKANLKPFNDMPIRKNNLCKLTLNASSIIIALFIPISRFVDHKHHISDIIAGALIGCFSSLVALKILSKKLQTCTEMYEN
ncbi:hypothetical protein EDEG_01322 [Edhazardia aedis USNM 41457]|uniref:Phosphatidic acid phosphatase type 2/haloperoxidase domain-containing protein n=1 Tax=Edhazardia aedis (strain USNM 41457) TaxID=1003232 RepID=J9DT10_EDHAE|nr:hypothetical protein EDEG_01322 [Edhazardia aedis USNM 41457]|eukprot:EJW04452.1 hypothetical protein EDEG_01322 [Edhazardia aedis USNM 41457]